MSLLDVSGLSIRFGNTEVVSDVSFSLQRGERFGIIGESGSGKTLTTLAIAGLLPDDAVVGGTITLDGEPLPRAERAMARLRGERIGMVFQEPMTALNPLMRVNDQIEEAIRLNIAHGAPQTKVGNLLEEVGLERRHGERFPHQLSGGQRQRVMTAMALASRPDLLIADEPTSALDLITQRKVLDLIADICARRQMTLLFISHDLKAVAALCTRVAVMHDGRLVETGDAMSVFSAPKQPYTQRLVAASRFDFPPLEHAPLGGNLLEVDGIVRDYRQSGGLFQRHKPLRAVDAARFAIASGECLALVGPSGCGKTTLAKIIVGLDRATAGEVRLEGRTYHGSDLPKDLRRDISLVFQDPFGSFNPRLNVADSLGEPLRLEPGLTAETVRQRLVESVEAVGLDAGMLERYPHEFSGGQRQRLAIARALVTRPKLVVLDEPVSALDMSVRGEVLALLARLQADFGLTYLIISHDLDMVHAMADRVLVMEAGRIVEEGKPDQLFARPQHRLTRDLVAARLPQVA
ncbi:MAG: ABC transporter ATP-binding protein [Alphaproteobacteria bacterium]|nr:ABC transporter ATP-binding protein [Alphaproteobacteria bacterium]MBU1562821.1 ABC transporter ATP-binding protein [Alphaproteobacteria bacterium]MBU2302133.1 ABC transporter ATP-binding protein [Alphaproteobacteria bacterium]MBU2368141.1 ABC transporter ATP-binding protein [Alphaproteobacteria bacterium]